MIRKCLYCKESFNVPPCKIKIGKGKYCSMDCYHKSKSILVKCIKCGKEFWKTKKLVNSGRGKFCSKYCKNNYILKQKKTICQFCGKDFIAKVSELKRGGGKYCSQRCFNKDYKNKYSGVNSSNWKGGTQREKHNGDYRYSNWRLSVYERDDFACQECGIKGGKLNAHHIFKWSEFKSLRYELWNGITLCEKCHKKEHSKRRKQDGYSEKR